MRYEFKTGLIWIRSVFHETDDLHNAKNVLTQKPPAGLQKLRRQVKASLLMCGDVSEYSTQDAETESDSGFISLVMATDVLKTL